MGDDLIKEVNDEDDIEELRKEVEKSMNLAEVNQNVAEYILKCTDEVDMDEDEELLDLESGVEEIKQLPEKIVDEAEIEDDDEDKDDVGNLRDFNSKFKPFR